MAVEIRRARRTDAATIAEFAVALFELHEKWDPRRFTQIATPEGAARFYGGRAEAENAAVFIAENDGKAVGFAYLEFEPVLYAELAVKAAWLHDIYVDEDARGGGAGNALLDAVRNEARRLGANKVLLSVAVKNIAGEKFFEQNGFTTTMHEMMLVLD